MNTIQIFNDLRAVKRAEYQKQQAEILERATKIRQGFRPIAEAIMAIAPDIYLYNHGYNSCLADMLQQQRFNGGSLILPTGNEFLVDICVNYSTAPIEYEVGNNFDPKVDEDEKYNKQLEEDQNNYTRQVRSPFRHAPWLYNHPWYAAMYASYFDAPTGEWDEQKHPKRTIGQRGEKKTAQGLYYVLTIKNNQNSHSMSRKIYTEPELVIDKILKIYAEYELQGEARDKGIKDRKATRKNMPKSIPGFDD